MKVGEVSDVVRSASGFHLVQLADRRDSERLIVRQARARHILIRPNEVTNSEQARARLEQLRQRIVEGEDFAELAREHSDDTGSGGLGGDLGWFTRGKMVDDFQEVVDATPVNQISPVFRTQFGWHVLEVLGRREVDETQENKRAKIREQLREQKQAEVLELWQQRLRDQAFVKIITDA
jgi:peptidyl-prolyl cis-trans isomerase SurA